MVDSAWNPSKIDWETTLEFMSDAYSLPLIDYLGDDIVVNISPESIASFGEYVFGQAVYSASKRASGSISGSCTRGLELYIQWDGDLGPTPYTRELLQTLQLQQPPVVPEAAAPPVNADYAEFQDCLGETVLVDISRSGTDAINSFFSFGASVIDSSARIGTVRGVVHSPSLALAVHFNGDIGVSLLSPALVASSSLQLHSSDGDHVSADVGYSNVQQHRLRDIPAPPTAAGGTPPIVRVILQNVNGPCPLLAIANTLILRQSLAPVETGYGFVTVDDLVEDLCALVMAGPVAATGADGAPADAVSFDDLPAVLSAMTTGLDVNVSLDSPVITEAAKDAVRRILTPLGVRVFHPWIPSARADDELVRRAVQVGGPLYDDLIVWICKDEPSPTASPVLTPAAAPGGLPAATAGTQPTNAQLRTALQRWLDATADQATPEGLAAVVSAMHDGEIGVLFRNNHFATVIRRGEELYALVSDIGFASEDSRHGEPYEVWEQLVGPFAVLGDVTHYNGHFVPSLSAREAAMARQAENKMRNEAYFAGLRGGTVA